MLVDNNSGRTYSGFKMNNTSRSITLPFVTADRSGIAPGEYPAVYSGRTLTVAGIVLEVTVGVRGSITGTALVTADGAQFYY